MGTPPSITACCNTWWRPHVLPGGYSRSVHVGGWHWAMEDSAPFSRYAHPLTKTELVDSVISCGFYTQNIALLSLSNFALHYIIHYTKLCHMIV